MSDQIYFARPVGQKGPVKIGCSGSPSLRLSSLGSRLPWKIEFAAKRPGPYDLERRLHAKFLPLHLRHEWFSWSPEMQEVIDAINDGSFDPDSLPAPVAIKTLRGTNLVRPPYMRTATVSGETLYERLHVVPIAIPGALNWPDAQPHPKPDRSAGA